MGWFNKPFSYIKDPWGDINESLKSRYNRALRDPIYVLVCIILISFIVVTLWK